MKYLGSSFTVALGGDAYGEGWERIWGAKARYLEALRACFVDGKPVRPAAEFKRLSDEADAIWGALTADDRNDLESEFALQSIARGGAL